MKIRKLSVILTTIILLLAVGGLSYLGKSTAEAASTLDESDVIINSKGIITWYNGNDTDIIIPDEVNGIKVSGIGERVFMGKNLTSIVFETADLVSIGAQAFQNNKLTTLALPNTVKTIDEQAFMQNKISNLTLSDSLTEIGKFAFRDNNLSSLVLPGSLEKLSEGSFMQNSKLSSVDLKNVEIIGDSVFFDCNFDTVLLPTTLKSYGANVFANNRRYVVVSGSGLASTYSLSGQFGEIVGEIRTLTVKFQDLEGNELLSDARYTTNRNIQVVGIENLVVDGNTVTIKLPTIEGFDSLLPKTQKIPIVGDTEFIATYRYVGENPIIYGLNKLEVTVGEQVDLKAGVSAKDKDNNDLTEKIEIIPATIDTSYVRGYQVKYSVIDIHGKTTTEYREVLVGNNPMILEVANGWLYNDFLYSNDGTSLLGLSSSGQTKFDNGKTILFLPGKCPLAGDGSVDVPIKEIGDGTSDLLLIFPQNFTYINFDQLTSLVRIGKYSFGGGLNSFGARNTELDLSKCTKLENIDDYAFYGAPLVSLNLPGNSLKRIGIETFARAKFFELDFSNLTKLEIIDEGAFRFVSSMQKLNLQNLQNLIEIGAYSFSDAKIKAIDFSDCTRLEVIGYGAFQMSEFLTINFSGAKELRIIDGYAFQFSAIKELDLSNNTKLEFIGNRAFYFSKMTKLNLRNLHKLKAMGSNYEMGTGPFAGAKITELDLSDLTSLEYIGAATFSSSTIKNLNLSNSVHLKYIGSSAFAHAILKELDLSNNKELEFIGNFAFLSSPLTTLNLSNLRKLESIGFNAFYRAKLNNIDFSDLEELTSIGRLAFYDCQLAGLDLSNNTKLTMIEKGAFTNLVDKASIYLPDSLTTVNQAFGFTNEYVTWGYTNSQATTLVDTVVERRDDFHSGSNENYLHVDARKTHFMINKVGVYMNLKENSGRSLTDGCSIVSVPMLQIGNHSADIGRILTINAPVFTGYNTPVAQTVTYDGTNAQVIEFVYTKTAGIYDPKAVLTIKNTDKNQYLLGNKALLTVGLNVSTDFAAIPAGSEIVIPFNDPYINMDSVVAQIELSQGGYVTSWHKEGRELHLVLQAISGGANLVSFPIVFEYKNDGTTPYDWESEFNAYLIHATTKNIIVTSDLSAPAKTISYFTRGIAQSIIDDYQYNLTTAYTNRPVDVDDNTDVTFGWQITYSFRHILNYDIYYNIPKYQDNNNNTVYAKFIPENNPAWQVVSSDSLGNPTRVKLSTRFRLAMCKPGNGNYYHPEIQLLLRFPKALPNQRVVVEMYVLATAEGFSSTEQANYNASLVKFNSGGLPGYSPKDIFYEYNSTDFYIRNTKFYPEGEIILADKRAIPAKGDDFHGEFYDSNSARVFDWNISLSVGPKYTATNAKLTDHNLDAIVIHPGI